MLKNHITLLKISLCGAHSVHAHVTHKKRLILTNHKLELSLLRYRGITYHASMNA
jgi:hypothetical protein